MVFPWYLWIQDLTCQNYWLIFLQMCHNQLGFWMVEVETCFFHVLVGTRSFEQTSCALKSQLNTPWHWYIEANILLKGFEPFPDTNEKRSGASQSQSTASPSDSPLISSILERQLLVQNMFFQDPEIPWCNLSAIPAIHSTTQRCAHVDSQSAILSCGVVKAGEDTKAFVATKDRWSFHTSIIHQYIEIRDPMIKIRKSISDFNVIINFEITDPMRRHFLDSSSWPLVDGRYQLLALSREKQPF